MIKHLQNDPRCVKTIRSITRRLSDQRNDHDWNQKEAAEHIGVAEVTYARYERGERPILLKEMLLLARHYGKSLDYMAGLSDVDKSSALTERKKEPPETYGPRLLALRHNIGISQKKFADQIGLYTTTYVRYENSTRHLPFYLAALIAQLYHMSIDDMLGDINAADE